MGPESVVIEAQHMVSAQTGCSLAEALTLLQAEVDVSGVALRDLAGCIVDGSVRFDHK